MFFVYVIRSKSTKKRYIGHTEDLQNRLKQHQSGSNKATKHHSDWKLIYSEEHPTKILAVKRESYFKTGDGRRVLKLKGIA